MPPRARFLGMGGDGLVGAVVPIAFDGEIEFAADGSALRIILDDG